MKVYFKSPLDKQPILPEYPTLGSGNGVIQSQGWASTETLDTIVLIVNVVVLTYIVILYLYRIWNQPKPIVLKLDHIDDTNVFPYFQIPKYSKKTKNREFRDHKENKEGKQQKELGNGHIDLTCEKCSFVTDILEKNLITCPENTHSRRP